MASNTLLTIDQVTRALLADLRNNLSFTAQADRTWQREFAQEGYKIGSQLQIRKTPKFVVQSGAGFVAQNYVEEYVTLVVDQQKHVDVEFGSVEMTLSLDDWNRRIGQPQAIQLANEVDTAGLATYWQVANALLSPDTVGDKWYTYLKAAALLDDEATPMDGQRYACLDQWEEKAVVNENKGLFQSSTQIKNQYEEGTMGLSGGLSWSMDQNVATHTTGQRGGAPVVNGLNQTGSSLVTNAWTAAAANRLKKGDVFVVANVYAVNPKNRLSTGRLRRFTVTADVSSDASGNATIPISPAIVIASDARQNVTRAPTTGDVLSFLGDASTTYKQNLVAHKKAFTVAIVPLVMPTRGMAARASDPDIGVSMRVWKDSDIITDSHPARTDILFGWVCQRPEWAVRVWSKVVDEIMA